MTEEEARKKMCCAGGTYRPSTISISQAGTCVGSECMAWRDNTPPPERRLTRMPDGNEYEVGGAPHVPTGYCGLAGKPHGP